MHERSETPPQDRDERAVTSQVIVNVIAAALFGLLGWLGNNVWIGQQNQQVQINQLTVELARNYIPRAELQAQLDRMNTKLDDIQQQTRKAAEKR